VLQLLLPPPLLLLLLLLTSPVLVLCILCCRSCSRRTRPYDETCNQWRYGSLQPPEYDLSRITTPQVHESFDLAVKDRSKDISTSLLWVG
jgi:hypothetical protein